MLLARSTKQFDSSAREMFNIFLCLSLLTIASVGSQKFNNLQRCSAALQTHAHNIHPHDLGFLDPSGSICDLAESDPSQHFHMCQRSFFQVPED